MHSPIEGHLTILRYMKGMIDFDLHLSSSITLGGFAFSDAGWVGCSLIQHSTIAYYVFLNSNYISWSTKKHHTISHLSTEAEYRAMAQTMIELTWIAFLLRDLDIKLPKTPLLLCDNFSSLYMTFYSFSMFEANISKSTTTMYMNMLLLAYLILVMFWLLINLLIHLPNYLVTGHFLLFAPNLISYLGIVYEGLLVTLKNKQITPHN